MKFTSTFRSFSAFGFRDYKLFWFGQLISLSGTWMQSVAQGWLVYSLTKSPFYLGMVAAAGSLPILLFTLGGGIAADRFRKRNLLLLTQALSILPALLLGILIDIKMAAVWQVALIAAFLGTVNAFDIPARQSFMAELVGKENLTNAVALNSAAFHGARMIGPVIAGIAIANIGLSACFYLNAVSFLAVIVALSKIRTVGEAKISSQGILKDLFEDIYFDYDEYEIRAAAKAVLEKISTWMLTNRASKISIEGHCDERGTNEYNLALGDRRAKAARDVLIALGVPSGRIEMISYGEEKPVCSEKTDACYAKNRRAHFVFLKEAGK